MKRIKDNIYYESSTNFYYEKKVFGGGIYYNPLKNLYNSKYDEYGVTKSIPWEDIKKGDKVCYIDSKCGENNKTIKVSLYGIWDGKKVEFNDSDKTVVRNIRWLSKVDELILSFHNSIVLMK